MAGYLDRYLTGTGFDIQPVVGVLADGFALGPRIRARWRTSSRCRWPSCAIPPTGGAKAARSGGRQRRFYAFTYQGHEIWGATAAIVVNLAQAV